MLFILFPTPLVVVLAVISISSNSFVGAGQDREASPARLLWTLVLVVAIVDAVRLVAFATIYPGTIVLVFGTNVVVA